MEKEKEYFTIGQMAREGLLFGKRGGAIRNKTEVSHIVNKLDYHKVKTPHGRAKCLTREQIGAWNDQIIRKASTEGTS